MDVRKLMADNAVRLAALYGGEDQTARYEKLAETFREKFHREPERFVSAPGRTEVVGNHTDHQNGRVLAASVNLDTVAAVAPREDNVVKLYSEGYRKPFEVDLSDLSVHENERETTLALIRGVAAKLNELGYRIGGFEACVTSTVFRGSGLSSSAAFEVMLVAVFDALYNGWTVPAETNARISQFAENAYFGKPSGLLDQMASAMGGLVAMDFGQEPATVQSVSYDFGAKGYAVCVVAVGGDHGNLTADYAAIPLEMKAVAQELGREVLCGVTEDELMQALPRMKRLVTDRAILRAFHFIDETERPQQAVDALRRDDLDAFFRVVIESGESSWKLLQNLHVPRGDNQEIPLALEMSHRLLRGRGAWRVHGGGFAGTILAFVPFDDLAHYRDTMDAVFGRGATAVLSIRPEGAVTLA